MKERTIGYSLIGIGLIVMLFCVINIIMVFTNNASPVPLFDIEQEEKEQINLDEIISQSENVENISLDSLMPGLDIIPNEVLNKTLNLSVHFFLMSFILGFGYKLASLGVQLVRPINVKLKENPPIQNPPPTTT
jgi:hypothetical protein